MSVIDSYYTTIEERVKAVFVPFTKVVNASKNLYNTCVDNIKRRRNNAKKASIRLD